MTMMQTGSRPLTRAALSGRRRALDEGRSVSRKELSAAGRAASEALDLRPSLRAVLSALCAVWGEQAWERLIVWPSNDRLCSMTGLSERALRYAIRDLVALEIVTPKDSANGKRYAIRAPGGAVVDAYGLDLTPLRARMGEWENRLREAAAEVERRRRSFDLLTVHRRAVAEAVHGLLTRFPETEVGDLVAARASLERDTPQRRTAGADPDLVLEAWGELRQLVEERFYTAACAGNSCPHIETNNEAPSEPCTTATELVRVPPPPLDPELVAAACPVAVELLGANLTSEADVLQAGRYLRSSIGAHPSAWTEACESLGPVRAAVLVLIVAQQHSDEAARGDIKIRNPGGYFRQIVRLCAEGRYGIGPELMAMRRRKMS